MNGFPDKYCLDIHNYERFPVREVKIGDIGVGGTNPIRLQSMTNIPATNIKGSILQIKQIFDAGADFVRIATPRILDLECLKTIKSKLNEDGYKKPLIADVHFNPIIAEKAAEIVEKVRINPGNYAENKALANKPNYSESEYKLELERIHEKVLPLIKICKRNGTSIRIGSNHGSLSERIVAEYGNTITGMVEAALEYLDIFMAESFYNIIVSMKASDVRTTVKACRLLNAGMLQNSAVFPQHLGVTEAGQDEDGRLKSAIGIGALLNDGIGDTVRVSLTENPKNEIVFAKKLTESFNEKKFKYQLASKEKNSYNPYINRNNAAGLSQISDEIIIVGNDNDSMVNNADLVFTKNICDFDSQKKYLLPYELYKDIRGVENIFPLFDISNVSEAKVKRNIFSFLELRVFDIEKNEIQEILSLQKTAIILETSTDHPTGEVRYAYEILQRQNKFIPVIVKYSTESVDKESIIAELGIFPGSVLIDDLISGLWLFCNDKSTSCVKLSFDLLQSTEIRLSKAVFISCPGCGRTQYDLESTGKQVKKAFEHLKGLKIAVMGCLVNGPGEMADAHYGCIGAKKDHVHIYKGQAVKMKNVPQEQIVEKLKILIKENGDWMEK